MKTLRGVVAPILTPFNDDLSIATDLFVEKANALLEEGAVGLAPFGTTGEALSVSTPERLAALKALADRGEVKREAVAQALKSWGIDADKPNPMQA